MSYPTIENAVEVAFAAVLRLYETDLAAVRINLSSTGLDQTPVADDEGTPPIEYLPLPVIRLTAMSDGEEEVRNSGAYAVELEIAVEDQAEKPLGEGLSLDDLFTLATRPLIYAVPTFSQVMDTANSVLRMHGIDKRQSSKSQEAFDASFIRRKTVTIHCALR